MYFVGLQDIVRLVEDRRLKFVYSLIKSGSWICFFFARNNISKYMLYEMLGGFATTAEQPFIIT